MGRFDFSRFWIMLGAFYGATAVAMAAVAAHALPARLDAHALASVQSAIQMQGWHALALVLTGVWLQRSGPSLLANAAGAGFALGVLLFSGAIYSGTLALIHLGPAAPTGGVLLMAAWLALGAAAAFQGAAR